MKKQGAYAIILVCAISLSIAAPVSAGTSDNRIEGIAWWWTGLPALISGWWVGLVPGDGLEVERLEVRPTVEDGGPLLVGQAGETSEPETTELSPAIDPDG
jgi:hypothetical protein